MPWNRVAAALQDLLAPRAGGDEGYGVGAVAAEGDAGGAPLRSGKQCRERWVHRLRPGVVTGDWTPEEEDTLFELVRGGEGVVRLSPLPFPPRTSPAPAPTRVCAGAAARHAVVAPRAVHATPQRPQPQEQVPVGGRRHWQTETKVSRRHTHPPPPPPPCRYYAVMRRSERYRSKLGGAEEPPDA